MGAGEYAASFVAPFAETWLVIVILLVLIGLFGYGFAVPATREVVVFLLGVVLFFAAFEESERGYCDSPWLRGQRTHFVAAEETNAVKRDFSRRIGLGLEHDRTAANLNRAILLGERRRLSPAFDGLRPHSIAFARTRLLSIAVTAFVKPLLEVAVAPLGEAASRRFVAFALSVCLLLWPSPAALCLPFEAAGRRFPKKDLAFNYHIYPNETQWKMQCPPPPMKKFKNPLAVAVDLR